MKCYLCKKQKQEIKSEKCKEKMTSYSELCKWFLFIFNWVHPKQRSKATKTQLVTGCGRLRKKKHY